MELTLSNNLFLGKAELDHLVEGIKESGYERIMKQMITSYGVVKPAGEAQWTYLQPVSAGVGLITIKAGKAVDTNLDVIEVLEDLNSYLTVPGDSATRYVYCRYRQTNTEEGTLSITAEGVVTGIGTKFTERLRGQGNFPSRIRILQNQGGPELFEEYEVQAIQSDTQLSLNIAAGVIEASAGRIWTIVGSFTPGIVVPTSEKYPFENDDYSIFISTTEPEGNDLNFMLCEVVNNGIVMTITDRRHENIFNINPPEDNEITDFNHVIGVEYIKWDNPLADQSKNLMRLGWGVYSLNGNWSMDVGNSILSIQNGSGGIWDTINNTSIIPEDPAGFSQEIPVPDPETQGLYKGWYVVYEDTGLAIKITDSEFVGVELQLTLEFHEAYPISGEIRVVPDGNQMEIRITNATNHTANRELTYAMKQGFAIIPIEVGSTSLIEYRHIKGVLVTQFRTINDGDYWKEEFFATETPATDIDYEIDYANGLVTPTLNPSQNVGLLDKVISPGFIIDYFGTLEQAQGQAGFAICDGSVIDAPGSIFHQTASPNLMGRVTVGVDINNPDYESAGNIGGEQTVIMTEAQMPSHVHTGNTDTDAPHSHHINQNTVVTGVGTNQLTNKDNTPGSAQQIDTNVDGAHSHHFTTGTAGGDAGIDVRQKFYVVFKLMKI